MSLSPAQPGPVRVGPAQVRSGRPGPARVGSARNGTGRLGPERNGRVGPARPAEAAFRVYPPQPGLARPTPPAPAGPRPNGGGPLSRVNGGGPCISGCGRAARPEPSGPAVRGRPSPSESDPPTRRRTLAPGAWRRRGILLVAGGLRAGSSAACGDPAPPVLLPCGRMGAAGASSWVVGNPHAAPTFRRRLAHATPPIDTGPGALPERNGQGAAAWTGRSGVLAPGRAAIRPT
jgi:hypothetical protein